LKVGGDRQYGYQCHDRGKGAQRDRQNDAQQAAVKDIRSIHDRGSPP
jgi:hypothetical protein